MQVPDYTFRPLSENDRLRDNEVEVTAAQKERIEAILRDRLAELEARPHRSKGSKRRNR